MRQMYRFVILSVVLSLALVAGCAKASSPNPTPAASPAPAPAPKDPVKVTFRTDAAAAGYHAPFAVALKKGYYTAEGLDVTIGEGKGSATTVQLVANGSETFGWADFGTAMQYIAKGAPIKSVAVISQSNPLAVVSHVEDNIKQPKDLEGKTVGVVAGGADGQLIGPFLEATRVDKSKVTVINVDISAKTQVFMDKKVDAILAWVTYQVPQLEAKGIKLNSMPLANVGLNTLNLAIFASNDTIKNKPDMVEKFVRASLKGWAYAIDHQDEAINLLADLFPTVDKAIARGQLKNQLPLFHTALTKDKPLGWVAAEDVKSSEDILAQYASLPKLGTPDSYYTNQFVK